MMSAGRLSGLATSSISLVLRPERGNFLILIYASPSPDELVEVLDEDSIFAERYRGQAYLGVLQTVTTLFPTQSQEGDLQPC
jgi:hypothetical protein